MNLTKEQLATISNFIKSKGIHYLDVKMEILDHVASAVEDKLNEDTSLSFENALKQTHASFGIFGFGGVEDAIVNGMSKKYRRLFWKNFLYFFGFKYILILLSGCFLIFKAQVLINDHFEFLAYFLLCVILAIVVGFIFVLRHNNYKKLMVFKTSISYFSYIGSGFLIWNYVVGNTKYLGIVNNQLMLALSSATLVLFLVYILTAFKMAFLGIKESKILMQKYQSLAN